ncbi:ATP-dependent RNA helicase ddx24 [Sparganum proliferum]
MSVVYLNLYTACPSGIVLATDVAARGLDFTGTKDAGGVSWVVHFDVPRTTEVYIHRCGRTARAQRRGVSILLMEPSENVRWYKVAQSLNSSASGVDVYEGKSRGQEQSLGEQHSNLGEHHSCHVCHYPRVDSESINAAPLADWFTTGGHSPDHWRKRSTKTL